MWIVWLERNLRSFKDNEKTLDELKVLFQRSLLEWFHCWGFTDCSSLSEFMSSLSLVSCLLVLLCCLFYFLVVHHHEQLVLFSIRVQIADIFSKALCKTCFGLLCNKLGLYDIYSPT